MNCWNLRKREQQIIHNPQDCAGDVHHSLCGGGVQIVGFQRTLWASASDHHQDSVSQLQITGDRLIAGTNVLTWSQEKVAKT